MAITLYASHDHKSSAPQALGQGRATCCAHASLPRSLSRSV